MKGREWIWIAVIFGILAGLWLLAQPAETFAQTSQNIPPCVPDPLHYGPKCKEKISGGWGLCKDAQGGTCRLSRPCGYILNCEDSFTCEDALGPCVGPAYPPPSGSS